ncbi:MAG: ABC transporter ATP-binding protein [Candidatus Sumerlaeota bacterium]|nr:ABC transporter ATP-binding protein [Candidatus Sumerlaeota bacterium]
MIKIENLSKRYDVKWAVQGLNLEVHAGELFCFLGPNGAGKTTTIKMLTGLLRPTTGRALIGGYDIQAHPVEAKRLIGYVPDHPYVYEKLTGRDFYHFVGDMFQIPRERQDSRMAALFEMLLLTESIDDYIENYSHGMRQKLVISVALMREPMAVIIDEPMVGLDPRSAHIAKRLFKQQTQRGACVFLSTHTLSVAEELADRIGIINRGELIFLGTVDQLRERTRANGNLEELFLALTTSEGE